MMLIAVLCGSAAGDWYVPMGDQEIDGFDYIQISVATPYVLADVSMPLFFGLDADYNQIPAGEDWEQTFQNDKGDFASAAGPNLGDNLLAFDVWFSGDRQSGDRPSFHYQTYKDGYLVGNWDVKCIGPGLYDWVVDPGTWDADSAFPPWLPGDADFDTDVDIHDILIWQLNYTGPGATGKEWGDGDWDTDGIGDGDVDIHDALLWQLNYTGPHAPEPGTIALLSVGMLGLLRRRRGER
jgi:hypothetical protein